MLENTVDLLCKPYRWILSLCIVQRIVLAQGSTFPVTTKKTSTALIILYPCVALENTTAATVNEIIGKGVGGLVSDDSPPLTKPTLNIRVLQCA